LVAKKRGNDIHKAALNCKRYQPLLQVALPRRLSHDIKHFAGGVFRMKGFTPSVTALATPPADPIPLEPMTSKTSSTP